MGVLWGFTKAKPFWQWSDSFGPLAKSGIHINKSNALTCTAYYAGVTLIAQTLAQVPLPLYKRVERGKERAQGHQLYSLLHDEPNPYMCAFTFKETLQGHILTWGNAFAEIEWEGDVVRALWPLKPNCMQIGWKGGKLVYVYTVPGGDQVTLSDKNILHIPGFGFDGIIGYDPITLVREALGLSKAAEEFGSRFFSNGSQTSGVLTHPNKLSDNARTNMRKSWEEMHQGLSNQHRIAILEEGVSFHSIGVPPENAQFLETRKFQTSEVARFLHIPPHMIGDLEKATFSNIEHQGIEFVVYTMTPWFARWEQTINRKLLSLADRQEYFTEFLVAGLLRGDSQSRAAYYKERFFMGSMSPNDIREKENENPIPGGDEYYVPLNMSPARMLGKETEAAKAYSVLELKSLKSQEGMIRYRTAQAYKQVFIDAGRRIVKSEIKSIMESAREYLPSKKSVSKKAATEWYSWLDKFYGDFGLEIQAQMQPATNSLAEAIQEIAAAEVNGEVGVTPELESFLKDYLVAFSLRYISSSKGQLEALVRDAMDSEDEPIVVVETRLGEWEETRPGKVGMNETVQLSNAVAKFVFAGAGVIRLVWQTMGSKSCPICQEMNGKVVGIEQPFVSTDTVLEAEGQSAMKVYRPTTHPPLHQGCVCVISPG